MIRGNKVIEEQNMAIKITTQNDEFTNITDKNFDKFLEKFRRDMRKHSTSLITRKDDSSMAKVFLYRKREQIKSENWKILVDKKINFDKRINAAYEIIKMWYCRSYESFEHGTIKHPSYEQYISYLSLEKINNFPREITKEIRKKYPYIGGHIKEGHSYFI